MKRPVSATRGIRRKVTSATSNIKRSEQSSNYAASANLRRLNTPYHIQAGSAHPHAKTWITAVQPESSRNQLNILIYFLFPTHFTLLKQAERVVWAGNKYGVLMTTVSKPNCLVQIHRNVLFVLTEQPCTAFTGAVWLRATSPPNQRAYVCLTLQEAARKPWSKAIIIHY